MYVYIDFDKISTLKDYENYKLCYVDEINQTYWGVLPELQEEYDKISYDEYKNDWRLQNKFRHMDIPNPEYNKLTATHYAYFTPLSLDEQWGDDWNDAPYEHNAGEPYDSLILSTKDVNGIKFVNETADVNILVVRFALNSYNSSFPRDYDPCNSPFSVEMINAGAVAWIYDCKYVSGGKKKHVAIQAGVNPYEFADKVNQIKENNKDDWKHYDDED